MRAEILIMVLPLAGSDALNTNDSCLIKELSSDMSTGLLNVLTQTQQTARHTGEICSISESK